MHGLYLKRLFTANSHSTFSLNYKIRRCGAATLLTLPLLFVGQAQAATEGAGDNNTADAAGVVTVSVPDTLEGNLCREDDFISSPCAPSDPADVWSITNGTSGNVTLTWTSAVQVQLQAYLDSARTNPDGAPAAVTSGMAESLNGTRFYSVIITPQVGDTMTAYNVALAAAGGGNSAPTATGVAAVTVTEDTLSNFDLSGVTFADANGDSLTVTITVVEGTFSAPADGAGVGSGVTETLASSTSITLAGSAADINTYLDTASNIRYTGVNNQSGNASTTFTINANDGTVNPQVGMGDVNITAVNDAPTSIGFNRSLSFGANATGVNADLAVVSVTDTDGPLPLAISLATAGSSTAGTCASDADNGSFNLNGTSLRSSAVLTPRVYNICVQAADAGMPSLSFEQSFAITIVPVAATSTAAAFNSVTGAGLTPSFNFGDNNEMLTIADPSHIAGSNMNGRGGSDTLVVPNGSDLTTGNVTQFETLQIASGATVTMTEAQYELFSTITAPGAETIILGAVDNGIVTANANVENYQLNGAYAFTATATGVSVTGNDAIQTIIAGAGTDTMTGGNAADTFSGTEANLNGDTIQDLSAQDRVLIVGNNTIDTNGTVGFNGANQLRIDTNGNTGDGYEVVVTLGNNIGNSLQVAGIADQGSDTLITFQAETIAPTFDGVSSSPIDNATAVSVSSNIVLDFSENIQLVSGNTITLREVTSNATRETFTTSSTTTGTGSSGGSISVSADKITLNPGANLQAGTQYAVQIAGTTVEDLAGNDFAGISDDTTYNFTTAPEITIRASPTTLVEDSGMAMFIVSLQDGAGNAFTATENVGITVNLSTSSATLTSDYTLSGFTGTSDTVTINSGSTNASFTVTAVADAVADANETLTATLAASTSTGTATVSSTNSAMVTIIENAAPVITQGSATELVIDLNQAAPFPLTLNASDADSGNTLTWSITSLASNGTAAINGSATGTSVSINFTPDNASTFASDSFTAQVTDNASTPATDSIVVTVLSVPQKALNDIDDIRGGVTTPSAQPDVATYERALVTGVTAGAVLELINNAVRTQPLNDTSRIDTTAELQTIVNAILEGQDEDGDGLPNIFEGSSTADADGDGTANRSDIDSDNDGLGDALDSGVFITRASSTTFEITDTDNDKIADIFDADVGNNGEVDTGKLDANLDGVNDNWDTLVKVLNAIAVDADNDLVPSILDGDDNNASVGDANSMDANLVVFRQLAKINIDGDAVANHLDLDADNDGRLDVNEYGSNGLRTGVVGARDTNRDAQLDRGPVLNSLDDLRNNTNFASDGDSDGLINHLDVSRVSGVFDITGEYSASEISLLDQNNDGRIDSTTDLDNDGIVSFTSSGVIVDNNNAIFGLVVPVRSTSVSNYSNGIVVALLSLIMLLFTKRKALLALVLSIVSFSSMGSDWTDKLEWQVAVGQSEFDVNVLSPGVSVTDDNDHQYSLALAYRFHEDWAAQIKYVDLGGAELTGASNDQTRLEQEAIALNVIATLPVLEDSSVDLYGVLGVMSIERDREPVLGSDEDYTGATFGLGAKAQMDVATVSVEVNTYSSQVWTWSVGIGGHF